MAINLKRAHEPPADEDGFRVLVDRLWPRGISKKNARLGFWAKEVSPSNELRKWYSHDHEEWPEFKQRYFEELDSNLDEVMKLVNMIASQNVTFVYSSKAKWNNARALKEYLEARYPELFRDFIR